LISHYDIKPNNLVYCAYDNSIRLIDWQMSFLPDLTYSNVTEDDLKNRIFYRIKNDDISVAKLLVYLQHKVLKIDGIEDELISELEDMSNISEYPPSLGGSLPRGSKSRRRSAPRSGRGAQYQGR
jgi:hypothetical protein